MLRLVSTPDLFSSRAIARGSALGSYITRYGLLYALCGDSISGPSASVIAALEQRRRHISKADLVIDLFSGSHGHAAVVKQLGASRVMAIDAVRHVDDTGTAPNLGSLYDVESVVADAYLVPWQELTPISLAVCDPFYSDTRRFIRDCLPLLTKAARCVMFNVGALELPDVKLLLPQDVKDGITQMHATHAFQETIITLE
jgi:hypothetical protein